MHLSREQNYIQQVSIDCVIFGYRGKQLNVLLPKIALNGDCWALPGGFIYQDEDIDGAAQRILQQRTGIDNIYWEQFQVFGKAARNSLDFIDRLIVLNPEKLGLHSARKKEYHWFTRRFISIGYYALVDINKVIPQKLELDESIEWYDVKGMPSLIMDHIQIVDTALKTLRNDFQKKKHVFRLLPETFLMKEVHEIYEVIFERTFARNNFQKMILNLNALERLEKKYTGAANKAPYLYKLKK